jgi:hypothetical protein
MRRRMYILRTGYPKYIPAEGVRNRQRLNKIVKGEHAMRRLMARIYRVVRHRPDFHVRVDIGRTAPRAWSAPSSSSAKRDEWLVQLHLWNTNPSMFNFACKKDEMSVTWSINREEFKLEISYADCLLKMPEILQGKVTLDKKEQKISSERWS